MNDPKVSVIIPVYNGSKTLKQCLGSVLSQTYNNYEIIVVNNNSADDTEAIIKEFRARSERIKYTFEGYRSRGAARNAGIKMANGEIIAMTDSDCIVPANWLSELIKPIVSGDEMAVMGSEEDLVENYWARNIQKANGEFLRRNLNKGYVFNLDTKNFAIKASLIKEILFDPGLRSMEDFDLFLRLRDIIKIKFIPTVVVQHHHKSSLFPMIALQYDRAYWVAKIFIKHKCVAQDHPMVESLSFRNFIFFPFWLIHQFFKRPFNEFFFIFVSEVSWRAGIAWALVNPFGNAQFFTRHNPSRRLL